jgi:hypothetical protein
LVVYSAHPADDDCSEEDEGSEAGSLDDAEAMAMLQDVDLIDEVEEVQNLQQVQIQYSGSRALQEMLGLSVIERIRWMFGIRPSPLEMGHRLFQYIDKNGNGQIAIASLDLLVKILSGQLPFTKASFDHLEVLPWHKLETAKEAADTGKSVGMSPKT